MKINICRELKLLYSTMELHSPPRVGDVIHWQEECNGPHFYNAVVTQVTWFFTRKFRGARVDVGEVFCGVPFTGDN